MSIPPLVCSTPPPPEQCEDDKDHEDFDLQYNLSQDDDEDANEFSYGNYTTYNSYQTTTEPDIQWPHNVTETENIDKFSIKSCDTPISLNDNTTKVEEAIVEDLNLIIDKDNIDSTDLECPKLEVNKDDISSESSDNDSRIKDQVSDVEPEDLAPTVDSHESASGSPCFNGEVCDKDMQKSEICAADTVVIKEIDAEKVNDSEHFKLTNSLSDNVVESENVSEVNKAAENDDDFGDFEDFQFTNTQSTQVLPISSENPWDDNCESPAFEFKANFDNTEILTKDNNKVPPKDEFEVDNVNDDDDFGDFDDFKSSDTNTGAAEEVKDVSSNVSVFDVSLPDNELQICESISGLLTPIFAEEILEPDEEIIGKLESFLCETWGHLIDIDVRQPYMVNWNNSLGQKTLLKALCIDSRNILFGPKWHYNMPKYAANLSAAPLQPQKQAQSTTVNTETNEKTNKEPNTWVDPFTQNGQEYTYAEALLLDLEHLMATLDQMAHKHSTLKISELLSHACKTENESNSEPAKRPTDLDVFGEAPPHINKIYSSTIKVQPVRHINLPDTHIFTPTDSETPRSKTIHYDAESNPVPISMQSNKNEEKLPSEPVEIESEYWEFQDFKAPNAEVASIEIVTEPAENKTDSQPPVNAVTNPGVTYQTQILQPIKMEPVMPTLNWPDPGEVKETFDDFSDFISNSTWNSEKGSNTLIIDKKVDEDIKESMEVKPVKLDCIDDDFETFQSAPATTITDDFLDTFTSPQVASPNVIPKITPDNNNKSILSESKDKNVDNNMKIETKSPSLLKSSVNDRMFKQIPKTNAIKHLTSDILQPTNASTSGFSRNQQNSLQILQPLSLEGYSQINWPNPGIDLQDLSRFNPVDSVHTIKNEGSVSGNSKGSSPAHNVNTVRKEISDDDIWGDFVSSAPKPQQPTSKIVPTFLDDDEWTDFVSSPTVKPLNGLSTISLNVHTNLNKSTNKLARTNQMQLDIPQLNYITPKSNNRDIYAEKHFQNL